MTLFSNRFTNAITDIRTLTGPDIESDHNLLKINFKVKVKLKTEKKYEKRKIVNIFQNSKWKQEYAQRLNNSSKYWKCERERERDREREREQKYVKNTLFNYYTQKNQRN
jgi:broad specificity polyphosphatase/5'/3'-nucleotidase SurE